MQLWKKGRSQVQRPLMLQALVVRLEGQQRLQQSLNKSIVPLHSRQLHRVSTVQSAASRPLLACEGVEMIGSQLLRCMLLSGCSG